MKNDLFNKLITLTLTLVIIVMNPKVLFGAFLLTGSTAAFKLLKNPVFARGILNIFGDANAHAHGDVQVLLLHPTVTVVRAEAVRIKAAGTQGSLTGPIEEVITGGQVEKLIEPKPSEPKLIETKPIEPKPLDRHEGEKPRDTTVDHSIVEEPPEKKVPVEVATEPAGTADADKDLEAKKRLEKEKRAEMEAKEKERLELEEKAKEEMKRLEKAGTASSTDATAMSLKPATITIVPTEKHQEPALDTSPPALQPKLKDQNGANASTLVHIEHSLPQTEVQSQSPDLLTGEPNSTELVSLTAGNPLKEKQIDRVPGGEASTSASPHETTRQSAIPATPLSERLQQFFQQNPFKNMTPAEEKEYWSKATSLLSEAEITAVKEALNAAGSARSSEDIAKAYTDKVKAEETVSQEKADTEETIGKVKAQAAVPVESEVTAEASTAKEKKSKKVKEEEKQFTAPLSQRLEELFQELKYPGTSHEDERKYWRILK